MRFVGGHVSIAGGLPYAIDNTLKINGSCMQIFAGSPRLWMRKPFPEADVKTFLNGVDKHQLGPTYIHALYLVNLASDNQELLQKSIDSLVMDLQNGERINSAGVIVHIGSHQGRGFDTVKEQLVAVIQRILDLTNTTPLILENDAGQNGKIGSLEELAFLTSSIKDDRLKVCLDTAHLFESGYDLRSVSEVEKLIQSLKDINILNKISCLHLNDSATKLDSHRDMHANLGQGEIGLDGLRNFVNHQSLISLPLLLEVPGDDKTGPNLHNITLAQSL